MLEVGTKAPEFILPDKDGNAVSLTDFAGKKVVLYFYLRLTRGNTPASGLNGRWIAFSDLAGASPPASCGLASPHLCSLAGPSEFFGS